MDFVYQWILYIGELLCHNKGVVRVYRNQRAQNARGWAGVLGLARGGAHFEHVGFGKSFSAIESPCQGSCRAIIKALFGFTEINVLKMRAFGPGCWALPGVARILSTLISGRVSVSRPT